MPTTPYLIAGIRTMPEHMTSPGYRNFLTWLGTQVLGAQGHVYEWETAASLPPGERVYATYETITLWDDPIRGVVAVYDLDAGGYTTHDETVTLTSLPSNTGVILGDPT